MILGHHHPDTIKISLDRKKFICNDLQSEGRVDPRALPKVESLVADLNKHTKGACLVFPYYIFIFLLIYIGSFIGVIVSRKYYLLFIPLGFFAAYMIGICWFSISVSRFVMNVNKTIDKYRVELSPYYTLMSTIRLHSRRYDYSSGERAVYLIPVNAANFMVYNPMHQPNYQNNPNMMYNGGFYQDPNFHQNQYYPVNQYANNPPQQVNGFNTRPGDNQIYAPPQNIPVYTYNPQQLDNTVNDYEDQPLDLKGKDK